ncbi:interleukin-10 receptor subunit alpha [Genypterus blacodes]|uniref:interleukin-10 receptor subunit alpha n=1 Tax=Genypterus blacodes TaxID=154954 RepID=UPI003F75BF6D
MDVSNKTPVLFFLILFTTYGSGVDVAKLNSLVVNILDGQVIAHWDAPADAPATPQYNVEMAKYNNGEEWAMVASCSSITATYCDLTNLITDYSAAYKVRVQLAAGEDWSPWRLVRRFLPNKSELQPPSFTLWATSSTLTVAVHQKPILRKLFPFGFTYTIYLEERGREEKTTTAYLKDGDDQSTKTFDSLHWGKEYCVSIMVEGNGALSTSAVTPPQCLLLPEQEWFLIAMVSLSVLGVTAFAAVMLIILYFYLKRPEKMPVALKSPQTHWVPLFVEEGLMEVVTDKAWLLSRPEVTKCKEPLTPEDTEGKDDEQECRRPSMDSGVGMEPNRGSPPPRQEDSGCGSMGDSGSSNSCDSQRVEPPLLDGRTDILETRMRGDSGLGLGCQLDCSVNLDGPEGDGGGNYRSQSASPVQSEQVFKPVLTDSLLTDVVTGYRAGHHPCICSGAGQCSWCHKRDHYGHEEIRQYRAVSVEKGPEISKDNFTDSYRGDGGFPVYGRKAHVQMDTEWTDESKTSPQMSFIQLEEDFPLLTALSPLPLVEGGQEDTSGNNVSLSLFDVELQSD